MLPRPASHQRSNASPRLSPLLGAKAVGNPIQLAHSESSCAQHEVIDMPRFSSSVVSRVFLESKAVESGNRCGVYDRLSSGYIDLIESNCTGSNFRVIRTAELIEASRSDDLFLVLALEGSASVWQEGRVASIDSEALVLVDSSRCFELEFFGSMRALWLKFPSQQLSRRLIGYQYRLGRSLSTREGLGHMAAQMIAASAKSFRGASPEQIQTLSDAILDIVAVALAEMEPTVNQRCGSSYSARLLDRVQRYIALNLDDPALSPSTISQACRIGERSIRALFASHGTTVTQWILEHRLENCRRSLLANSRVHRSVSEIAYDNGFSNVSSFNRSFKKRFGVAPSQLRTDKVAL